MRKQSVQRLKKSYKYLPVYLPYRVFHNFTRGQRRAFRKMIRSIDCFVLGRLMAVGKAGLVYEGIWREKPDQPHLLKVGLNVGGDASSFGRVMDVVTQNDLPFVYRVPRFEVWDSDPGYWWQVMERVEGRMLSQYLCLSPRRRLALADPVALAVELVCQTQTLRGLGIVSPNVDAENVLLTPDGQLVRIDADPWQIASGDDLPLHTMRRLWRLVRALLVDYREDLGRVCAAGTVNFDAGAFNDLLERLRQSALYGYDDPRPRRHKHDACVDPEFCLRDCGDLLPTLRPLTGVLENTGQR